MTGFESDPGDEQPEPVEHCWLLVSMPDGYRVWADPYFDQFEDGRSLFMLAVSGRGERGEKVTVRGNHIGRVSRTVRPRRS